LNFSFYKLINLNTFLCNDVIVIKRHKRNILQYKKRELSLFLFYMYLTFILLKYLPLVLLLNEYLSLFYSHFPCHNISGVLLPFSYYTSILTDFRFFYLFIYN